jgi:hypothetical protein
MIITDFIKTQQVRTLPILEPTKTQKLEVCVFGKIQKDRSPFVRGLRFHAALSGFLPDGRLPLWAKPFYPYMATLRTFLRGEGFTTFRAEVDVVTGGYQGRADVLAEGRSRRAVIEVKTCSKVPAVPEPAAVTQAALYAASLPGPVGLIVAYIAFDEQVLGIFEWAGPACDLSKLQPAA